MVARLKGPVTLLLLAGLVGWALVYGYRLATQDVPPLSANADGCTTETVQAGDRLRSSQVTINVYNAGTVAGRADQTAQELTAKGFLPGQSSNAPAGVDASGNLILDPNPRSPAVALVRQQMLGPVRVQRVKTDLAEGVDLVVGNTSRGVRAKSPVTIRVGKDTEVCLPDSDAVS